MHQHHYIKILGITCQYLVKLVSEWSTIFKYQILIFSVCWSPCCLFCCCSISSCMYNNCYSTLYKYAIITVIIKTWLKHFRCKFDLAFHIIVPMWFNMFLALTIFFVLNLDGSSAVIFSKFIIFWYFILFIYYIDLSLSITCCLIVLLVFPQIFLQVVVLVS